MLYKHRTEEDSRPARRRQLASVGVVFGARAAFRDNVHFAVFSNGILKGDQTG